MSSLGVAAVAAVCALLVFMAASWAFAVAAANVWLDADIRHRVASDILETADRLQNQHRPLSEIAQTIIAQVNAAPGFTAAVVDDSGKLLAGNRELIGNRPLMPPPLLQPARQRTREFHGALYSLRPPSAQGVNFLHWPFGTVTSPSSFVRIDGAAVLFAPTHDALSSIQAMEHVTSVSLVAVTFALVWILGRRVLVGAMRPMERVRTALLRLAHGDYARFETFSSQDDVAAELVDAYNAAAAEMATVSRQRTEVEARIRQFVADAGHELRTPLAVIMGYVQLLRQGVPADDAMATRVFSEIDDQGKRMSVLIQKLLLLTRLDSQEPHDVKILDAADVAQGVVDSFRPLANGAMLSLNAQNNSFVRVSESELREAIGNLIDNALKYAPGAKIEAHVRAEGDSVFIAVSDDGPGMSPEVRTRAFERFSRGETGGSITGSGLGLAIVERAVQRNGGTVSLQTALGKGTTVELRLPAWSM